MRAGLGRGPGADVLLNLFPLLAVNDQSLYKPEMLFLCPAAALGLPPTREPALPLRLGFCPLLNWRVALPKRATVILLVHHGLRHLQLTPLLASHHLLVLQLRSRLQTAVGTSTPLRLLTLTHPSGGLHRQTHLQHLLTPFHD